MKKAFTLIELLVVISIIALLSSVVLASLNASRDKARIAAGRYFAAQADHIAGEMLVGFWNLDECSGTAPRDSSGNNNTASFQGAPAYQADTPDGKGCSLYFDGVDDTMRIPNLIATDTIHGPTTLSLWFKPASLVGSTNRIFSDNCYEWGIFTNGSLLYGGTYNNAAGGTVQTGKWYQATLVHEHPNGLTGTSIKLYVDGQLRGTNTWTFGGGENGYTNDYPYWIGADGCYAGTYFNGNIDDIRIYSKALTAAEVSRNYALEASEALAKP